MTSRVEAVAEILWHRYSPDHEDSWPSPNADEYRRVASDILSTLTTEPAASDSAETMLSNLLARIHRDGGHYEAMNGTEKAVADADNIIARIYASQPAAPEGRREAVRIGDAVLDWMVKFDLLDAGNEYYVSDVLAVLNDLTPSTRPAEQAVTEAMVERAEGAFFETDEKGDPKYDMHAALTAALKAAMEAGRHD